jgi:outer membrane protein TolC
MKKILLIVAIVAISPFVVKAQVDYSKIILPSNIKDPELPEKLVQLAWKNHPSNRLVEHEVQIQKELKKQNRSDWTKSFGVQGNVNEFVLNPNADATGRAAFFPKYNVYGKLSLDQIFVSPSKRRESNYRIRVAEETVNMQKLELRNEVLNAYQDYVKFAALYKIQTNITDEANTEFLRVEQKFKDGTSTLEEYNKANKIFTEHKRDKILAENAYMKSKYDLEALIGMKMEDIQ